MDETYNIVQEVNPNVFHAHPNIYNLIRFGNIYRKFAGFYAGSQNLELVTINEQAAEATLSELCENNIVLNYTDETGLTYQCTLLGYLSVDADPQISKDHQLKQAKIRNKQPIVDFILISHDEFQKRIVLQPIDAKISFDSLARSKAEYQTGLDSFDRLIQMKSVSSKVNEAFKLHQIDPKLPIVFAKRRFLVPKFHRNLSYLDILNLGPFEDGTYGYAVQNIIHTDLKSENPLTLAADVIVYPLNLQENLKSPYIELIISKIPGIDLHGFIDIFRTVKSKFKTLQRWNIFETDPYLVIRTQYEVPFVLNVIGTALKIEFKGDVSKAAEFIDKSSIRNIEQLIEALAKLRNIF